MQCVKASVGNLNSHNVSTCIHHLMVKVPSVQHGFHVQYIYVCVAQKRDTAVRRVAWERARPRVLWEAAGVSAPVCTDQHYYQPRYSLKLSGP